jgi:hypothetical protein
MRRSAGLPRALQSPTVAVALAICACLQSRLGAGLLKSDGMLFMGMSCIQTHAQST